MVVEVHAFGEDGIKEDSSVGGLDDASTGNCRFTALELLTLGQSDLDLRMQRNFTDVVSVIGFGWIGEGHAFALLIREHDGDVVATHNRVLRGTHDRLAVARCEDVVGAHHQRVSFHLGFDRQWQVNGHLVTVEVRIETFADQGVQVDRVAFYECWFEGLDTHAVERRGSVQ